MDVSIVDLEQRFDELVERAKAGESVVVSNGHSTARLTPVMPDTAEPHADDARAARVDRVIREVQDEVRRKFAGRKMPTSDHSEFYDEFGLPK